jgi:hypothetical protein
LHHETDDGRHQIFVLPDDCDPAYIVAPKATRKTTVSGPTPDTPKARAPIESKAQLISYFEDGNEAQG